MEKRRKLVGVGGHRIRAIIAETGAEVQTISDDHMSIFAPTREAMDDVMERVEAIFNEPEPDVMFRICNSIPLCMYSRVFIEFAFLCSQLS